ncbi:conserved hypothetical protein [Ricinus communis]|uniref:Uncharacterized protein n=1 Tax=Ricinus communis TaxID=3988 RepID=B9T983_RICCO|nr:conserved hypothetical protein [Ricinus communis]
MTCVLRPDLVADFAINDKAIVDKQLLAGIDRSERVNEHAIAHLDGPAVGFARVIQKPCAVAAPAAVNDASV